MIRFFLGFLALIATLALAFWIEGGSLLGLFLPSVLLITFGMPFFAVLAVWDQKTWAYAWADAFSPCQDAERRATSSRLWEFYEKVCYAAGFLAFVAGCIVILGSENVTWARICETFSINFTSPLWAVLFAIGARILRYRVTLKA